MNFLEKDERDYVSEVKSMEDNIKLLLARAFNAKLKPDLYRRLSRTLTLGIHRRMSLSPH